PLLKPCPPCHPVTLSPCHREGRTARVTRVSCLNSQTSLPVRSNSMARFWDIEVIRTWPFGRYIAVIGCSPFYLCTSFPFASHRPAVIHLGADLPLRGLHVHSSPRCCHLHSEALQHLPVPVHPHEAYHPHLAHHRHAAVLEARRPHHELVQGTRELMHHLPLL